MYELDFDATMTLVTGYDAVLRVKVITRWRELETGEATPVSEELLLAKAILIANDKIQKQQAQIEEMKLIDFLLLARYNMFCKISPVN